MRTWGLRLLHQLFHLALSAIHMLATAASAAVKSRATLQLENLALRYQLGVLRRSAKQPKLTSADRLFWTWLCEVLCNGDLVWPNAHATRLYYLSKPVLTENPSASYIACK